MVEIGPFAELHGPVDHGRPMLSADIPNRGGTPAATWLPTVSLVLEPTHDAWAASSSIATADATVRDLFDHARFSLPGMIAENGVMDAGIFEYGNQWVRDTSFSLEGLVYAGQFELARSGFEHVLKDMLRGGAAMVDSKFDNPDREELDQMGELVHALKTYRDWTGDDSLLREHRAALVAMIERPLQPEFRDQTGMVHNRREFFERTFDDGYELAYQTYVVLGLRDAADLAEPLGAADRAARWRAEAQRMLNAMLTHPTRSLVNGGRLIKRRGTDGRHVTQAPGDGEADSPGKTEQVHLAEPDTTHGTADRAGVGRSQNAAGAGDARPPGRALERPLVGRRLRAIPQQRPGRPAGRLADDELPLIAGPARRRPLAAQPPHARLAGRRPRGRDGGLVRGDSGHSLDGFHLRHRSLGQRRRLPVCGASPAGHPLRGPPPGAQCRHSIRTARRWRPICGFARAG